MVHRYTHDFPVDILIFLHRRDYIVKLFVSISIESAFVVFDEKRNSLICAGSLFGQEIY